MKAIDLGLSVLWGDCNLGADEVYQEGDLYTWTEIVPEIDYYNALFSPVAVPSSMTSDIAERILGYGWKVPTKDHIIELMQKCEFEFIPMGLKKAIKATGPNGNSIYFPLSGNLDWNGNKGQGGFYWTSTKATEAYNQAYQLKFTHQLAYGYNHINVQQSVRPVFDPYI